MLKKVSICIHLILSLIFVVKIEASIVKKLSFDEIIVEADEILRGVITEKWVYKEETTGNLITVYEFYVLKDYLRSKNDQIISFSMPGGRLDNYFDKIVGIPEFKIQNEIILFMKNIMQFPIVGFNQGVFFVEFENADKIILDYKRQPVNFDVQEKFLVSLSTSLSRQFLSLSEFEKIINAKISELKKIF